MRPILATAFLTISLSNPAKGLVGAVPPAFHRGNVNGDGAADISDAIFTFSFLFLGGESPACLDAADANDDGQNDISDGVYLLSHLFQGGPAPPPPSPAQPCPGPDPTPDDLGCGVGNAGTAEPPGLSAYPTAANAPGVRERSRTALDRRDDDGAYVVPQGTSFAILLEAASNPVSRSGFALRDPGDSRRGDPASLRVVCDRPLGEPARGGAAAGDNLAPWFFADLDGWSDAVFLTEHAALRVAHDGPLAPAPGLYRFTAAVTDLACASSSEATFLLAVLPSQSPEIFTSIQTAASPPGEPLSHHPGSGNVRVGGAAFNLVIDLLPRGGSGAAAPDPATLRLAADPPLSGAPDPTALLVADPRVAGRFRAALEPAGVFPGPGSTTFTLEAAAAQDVRRVTWTLERPVAYAADIQPLWNEHCTGCHERPRPEKGLELVAAGADPSRLWRNIVHVYAAEPDITSTAPLHVWPYHPGRSYLFHKLEGTHTDPGVGGEGVRMPKDAPPLSAAAMHLVRSWIAQGAER